jgi:hypothetical protein
VDSAGEKRSAKESWERERGLFEKTGEGVFDEVWRSALGETEDEIGKEAVEVFTIGKRKRWGEERATVRRERETGARRVRRAGKLTEMGEEGAEGDAERREAKERGDGELEGREEEALEEKQRWEWRRLERRKERRRARRRRRERRRKGTVRERGKERRRRGG